MMKGAKKEFWPTQEERYKDTDITISPTNGPREHPTVKLKVDKSYPQAKREIMHGKQNFKINSVIETTRIKKRR